MDSLINILKTLSIPDTAGRIYTELLTNGETTPRMLSLRLSVSRPSVYDHIRILESSGLVALRDLENKTYVSPTPPQHLLRLLEEKKRGIERAETDFTQILKSLTETDRTEGPRIRFFEGREAVQVALHDILWTSKTDILALWPYDEMLEFFGTGFLKTFNEKRVRQKITLKTIWPQSNKAKKNVWEGNDTGVERRYIQHTKSIGMGYTIYEDNVIFISSAKESYGFIISSKDFATMMRFQFSLLWENAIKK